VSFVHPTWAAAVAAAVGLAAACTLLSWLWARRRARALLGAPEAVGRAEIGWDLVLVAALAAIGLALLGPRVGSHTVWLPAQGLDLVLLLDVSLSMDAQDVPPSRLVRARRAGAEILDGLAAGDRAALAAFGSRGVLLTPLTPDVAALGEMLPAIDSTLMQEAGSNLDGGVKAALGAFEASSERPRVLVVLSDGEDPDGAPTGAEAAARAGVRVVAIALGTEEGASVPDGGVPLLDRSGRPVVSRRDAARLRALVGATGGALFEADAWGEVDLSAVGAEIRRGGARAGDDRYPTQVAALRVAPLAAAAFALLALELAAARRSSRLPGVLAPAPARALPRRRRIALAATLVAMGAASGEAPEVPEAREAVRRLEAVLEGRPAEGPDLLALGVARARLGLTDEARRALTAAALVARDLPIASLAYYDLGVLLLEQGEYEGARDAFLDALSLDPSDSRAQFDLEWALRMLDEEAEPKAAPEAGRRGASEEDSEEGADGERHEAPPSPMEPLGRSEMPESQPLAPAEVDRWLDAVSDEAGQGLRNAVQESGTETGHRRRAVPRW
jgi:Ca-activated chloride channel homolog